MALEQKRGRPVSVNSIRAGDPIPYPDPVGRIAGSLVAGLEQQDVVIDSTEAAVLVGITLTPARSVLTRLLTPVSQ